MSHSKRNFYDILNVSSSASFNEIKSRYKQLILQFHPDKLRQQQLEFATNDLQINVDPNNLEFVAITEAWNCLKDPLKRKQYDAELLLNKFHMHNNIYAHIKLSEMKKQPNTSDYYDGEQEEGGEETDLNKSVKDEEPKYLYTYDCRCGGQYIVDESAEQYCRSNNNHNTKINNSDNNCVDDDDDDADNKIFSDSTTQNNKRSPNISKYENNAGGCSAAPVGSKGVVQDLDDVDVDEEDNNELIVECSECSLVIILLNG